jgi:Rod binding domain-containing protein
MRIGDTQEPTLPTLPSADETRLDGLRKAAEKGDTGETSRQFETLFSVMLVRELRRSMPESPFGEGAGADVYEGWFDEHLGNSLAQRDSLGLAGMVKAAIGRAQSALDAAQGNGPSPVAGPAQPALELPAPRFKMPEAAKSAAKSVAKSVAAKPVLDLRELRR